MKEATWCQFKEILASISLEKRNKAIPEALRLRWTTVRTISTDGEKEENFIIRKARKHRRLHLSAEVSVQDSTINTSMAQIPKRMKNVCWLSYQGFREYFLWTETKVELSLKVNVWSLARSTWVM